MWYSERWLALCKNLSKDSAIVYIAQDADRPGCHRNGHHMPELQNGELLTERKKRRAAEKEASRWRKKAMELQAQWEELEQHQEQKRQQIQQQAQERQQQVFVPDPFCYCAVANIRFHIRLRCPHLVASLHHCMPTIIPVSMPKSAVFCIKALGMLHPQDLLCKGEGTWF